MNCKGNKLWRITIDTNPEDCNYQCIMCEEHSQYSHFKDDLFRATGCRFRRMPVEWLDGIMEEAARIGVAEIIPSTMGEPLLYGGIDSFFDLAAEHCLRVNLTTNGSFPGKSIYEWAKIIVPVTTDVKISINGASKETSERIMRGSNFNLQMENIRRLVEYRNQWAASHKWYCSITLQVTFMRSNINELADIVRLAADLDVDRVKGHHLWAHFAEIEELSIKRNPQSIGEWNRCVDEVFAAQKTCLRKNGKMVRLENIVHLDVCDGASVPSDSDCPFLGRELWISATGRISPCCCPDERRRRLGDFGHYPDVRLHDVLASREYRHLVDNYKAHDVCRVCHMRRRP